MNSFSKAFYIENKFSINFTSKDIPDELYFKLNTNYFRFIIPGIYMKYPNKELTVTIQATKQPYFIFNKDNQSIEFSTLALFKFSLNESPEKSILSFNSDIFLDVRLGTNYTDSSVHLTINKLQINTMSIVDTEFPLLDINLLKSNLNSLFEIIYNAANKFYLVNGIQIPLINGLKFKKVVLKVEETSFSLNIQPDSQSSNFNWLRLF